MIKKFIQRVFGAKKSKKPAAAKERVYAREEHGIRRDELSNAAISVCEGLHKAGYKAFVVGGAVRDLLLKRHPKDYDVATDATPEQVRSVFRRARIIGRRFK
ncbi:MAG: polynucleotide adenylyltransferase PcnB, partial [Usitatibacteraceae bacterium]